MPLTLQHLKSHIWNCAEILRGSAVDRTDWKAYILPLLFFKRICDVWDEERAGAIDVGQGELSWFRPLPTCTQAIHAHTKNTINFGCAHLQSKVSHKCIRL